MLDKQERQWQTAQPKNYSYVLFSWYTFTRMTYEVTVRDGECTARSRARPEQKWTPDSCDGVRITDVFAELRKQWQSCPAEVRLEFDEKYGFISDLTFEPKTDLSDQDWSITTSKFKARQWRVASRNSITLGREPNDEAVIFRKLDALKGAIGPAGCLHL